MNWMHRARIAWAKRTFGDLTVVDMAFGGDRKRGRGVAVFYGPDCYSNAHAYRERRT